MALIDVIEWHDETGEQIVQRFPESGEADVKMGTQLVVRESQVCIFYRGGQALDTFGPGRHTLSTANIPILQKVLRLPFGGDTPFKAECFFCNLKTFINKKWGTKEPITFRDSVLKVVRLRSFGIMSYKISDPQLFINKIVGTQGAFTTDGVNDFMRNMVVARLTDVLGENLKTLLDLASLYDEIGIATKARISDDFAKYGLELEDMVINAITPPPEVQAKIDERSGLGLFEDAMPALQQQQMAYAMRDMAQNEGGGIASQGMGMGMGLGMGFMMPGMMQQAMPGGGMAPQQGMPPQGYPPPQQGGYPPQGYPPQGYPPQQQAGYPPQGYPPQQPGGYPPQQGGYPPQQPGGYPPQQPGGYPPQGAPAAGAAAGMAAGGMPPGATPAPGAPPDPGAPQAPPDPGAPQAPPQAGAAPAGAPCVQCSQAVPAGFKFCPYCGTPQPGA